MLHQQIEGKLREQYRLELAKKDHAYQQQYQNLVQQQAQLDAQVNQQESILQQRLQQERQGIQQDIKQKLNYEYATQMEAFEQELATKSAQLQELNKTKAVITRLQREKDEQKDQIEAELSQRFNQNLQHERKILLDKITSEMNAEISGKLQQLEQEVTAKSKQLNEFNQTKASLIRLEREKEELREQIILEKEREFSDKLTQERFKIQHQMDEQAELKLKEVQKQLDDQKNLVSEMNRKAHQGSMQIQGEVQELAIEEWLMSRFPLDTIEEIKKGARGADCLQSVHSSQQQNCGTIYYESKRTKDFQPQWIEKFKNDIREKNATIGVLVTATMPATMSRMGLKEGIWICSFEEFKGLSSVLRETVIKLSMVVATQENKGEKMEMLYRYLTSNEFKLQVEGIVEGFTQMQADLDTEKRSMARIWKQRDKQLQKVLLNTTHMYGSIKGIAGSAIATVTALELDACLTSKD